MQIYTYIYAYVCIFLVLAKGIISSCVTKI